MENKKIRTVTADDWVDRCGFSKSKLYREINEGNIPKPMKLGYRMSRWLESDIDDYLAKMTQKRNRVNAGVEIINASSIKPKLRPAVYKYKYKVSYHGWKIEDCPQRGSKHHFFIAEKNGKVLTDSVSFDHLIERLDKLL